MADVEAELSVDRQKLARARVITRGRHGLATPGRLGRAAGEGGAQGGRSERARARAWSGRGRGVQRKRARRVKDEADRHPAVAGAAGAAARLRLHGRRARRGHRQRDGGALRSFLLSRTISAPPPPLARDLRAPSRRRAALPLLPRNQLRAVSPQVLGSFTEEAGGLAAFRRWVSSWRSDADAAADEVEAAGSGDDDEQQAAADGTRARLRKFKTRHRKVRRNWTLPDDFPSAQARARRRRGPKRHALAPLLRPELPRPLASQVIDAYLKPDVDPDEQPCRCVPAPRSAHHRASVGPGPLPSHPPVVPSVLVQVGAARPARAARVLLGPLQLAAGQGGRAPAARDEGVRGHHLADAHRLVSRAPIGPNRTCGPPKAQGTGARPATRHAPLPTQRRAAAQVLSV